MVLETLSFEYGHVTREGEQQNGATLSTVAGARKRFREEQVA